MNKMSKYCDFKENYFVSAALSKINDELKKILRYEMDDELYAHIRYALSMLEEAEEDTSS